MRVSSTSADASLRAQHCAARGGFADVITALLAAGADKGAMNAEGRTPLQLVDAADDPDCLALLQ